MENQEQQNSIEGDLSLTNSIQLYLAAKHQEDPDWIGNHGEDLRKLMKESPELFIELKNVADKIDKQIH